MKPCDELHFCPQCGAPAAIRLTATMEFSCYNCRTIWYCEHQKEEEDALVTQIVHAQT
jgi:hypothetical protein